MKTIYTLTFILLLAGCNSDYSEANGISNAFLRSCKTGTIRTTVAAEGISKTLTITCNKDGN
jgi:hypothetical protein